MPESKLLMNKNKSKNHLLIFLGLLNKNVSLRMWHILN